MTVMSVPSKKSEKKIPIIERLIFALDYPSHDEALAMVDELGDLVVFYKLGLELFMAGDYFKLVTDLVKRDPLIIILCPSLSLVIFILRSILSDIRIATPAFSFPFA